MIAAKFINGERWIWWTQGGCEFLVKASSIGRMNENPGGDGITVIGPGGPLRVNVRLSQFVAAMESEEKNDDPNRHQKR